MLRNHRFHTLLKGISLFIILTTLGLIPLWLRHQDQAARAKPYGRLSKQEILKRTQALCSDLVPSAEQLSLASFPLLTQNKADARLRRRWQVEYTDASGKFSGIFEWDA